MTDAQDLARRYLALWEEYLTAMLADPVATGFALWGLPGAVPRDEPAGAGPAAGTTPIAGASGECRGTVAELARRIAVLEERVAGLERSHRERGDVATARPRRGNRRART